MSLIKYTGFKKAVFVASMLFLFALIFLKGQGIEFLMLALVTVQFMIVPASALLIILRLMGLMKNIGWIYCFLGIFQICLALTDIILLVTHQDLEKNSMLAFFSLNIFLGSCILMDLHSRV
jgi:hypothetical protein